MSQNPSGGQPANPGDPATRIEDLAEPARELGEEDAEAVKGGIKFAPATTQTRGMPTDQKLLLPAVQKQSGDGSV